MAISKTETKQMMKKLGEVEVEILMIKEKLLLKVKANKKELAAIRKARKEIAEGKWVSGDEVSRQLSH